jgi:hypothetical protein
MTAASHADTIRPMLVTPQQKAALDALLAENQHLRESDAAKSAALQTVYRLATRGKPRSTVMQQIVDAVLAAVVEE